MTTRALSSVSFNTVDFLRSVLTDLLNEGVITMYHFIKHYPETDLTKEHFHLFISPSRRVDPVVIRRNFIEPIPGNDKPLGCLPFVVSKFPDWLLYSLHDSDYLASKNKVRQHSYKLSDIFSSESDDYLRQEYYEARESLPTSRLNRICDFLDTGASWSDFLKSGLIPPSQFLYWREFFAHYKKGKRKGVISCN